MSKYKRKLEVVEAIQYRHDNGPEFDKFVQGLFLRCEGVASILITIHGNRRIQFGDWVVKKAIGLEVLDNHSFKEMYDVE